MPLICLTACLPPAQFYMSFPINDHTGDPLTDDEVTASHYEKVGTKCKWRCTFYQYSNHHNHHQAWQGCTVLYSATAQHLPAHSRRQ
jgi:hypothetical protein